MNGLTFKPSEAHKLDDPERLKWLPPAEIVEVADFRPGMTVADIGAGTGCFAIPIARAVAPTGKVYAVDLQPEMLELLAEKLAAPDAPSNIAPVSASASRTRLPDASCDVVFLANLWHELDDRAGALREFARILKPEGRLVLIDWRHDAVRPPGPPAEHRVPMLEAIRMLEFDGWELYRFSGAGAYSYILVAGIADQGQQT